MNDTIKTTIVIPNYNGLHFLKDCMQALQSDGNRAKVILVDNGSTDGSLAYMEQFFPEIKVIRFSENKGFCQAVNAGIMAADTPYVLLLNNDTKVKENFVKYLEQAIEQSEKVFSVAAKMLVMHQPEILDGAGDLYCALGWAFARKKGKQEETASKPCNVFSACGGAVIYRKSILDEIGLFDPHHFAYLEDLDIGYRARIFGYINRYEPKAVVLHAGSGASGSRYNEFKTRLASKNSIYVIYKNMPILQIILNFPLLLLGFTVKILFFVKKGMGKTYLQGLLKGIVFSFSREAKSHKVRFTWKHFGSYCKIQIELLWNIGKRIINN